MFSSPSPAPGSRTLATNALRKAGLIDRDAQMRDVADKPGGRKGSSKIRSHRPRAIDAFKDQAGPSTRMLATRMSSHAGPSDPLSIRGASRPTAVGRLRRNAVSISNGGSVPNTSTPNRIPTVRFKATDVWSEFVNKRWNPETRFLNLESMKDDEILRKHNLDPPGAGGSARAAAVIFKLASQLKPSVQTISLANNNLNGPLLTGLTHYLPKLANLSLQNNNLRTWRDMDFISARKSKNKDKSKDKEKQEGRLEHLRELILLGNPVREVEFQHGRGELYKSEIARRFPSLEMLDQEAITQISFDVPQPITSSLSKKKQTATTFPSEMAPSFITGVEGSIVSNFLMRFFSSFDTQRAALLDVYAADTTFSYSVNTTIPVRARLEGHHSSREMPNQRKLEWTPWLNGGAGGSRNLSRLGGGLDRMVKSLHIGADNAVKAIANLPLTKHDIAGPPDKFCVDSFPVDGRLLLMIHGEFTEGGTKGVRSFDRTFILASADPGSRAQVNGWDVVIVCDQWVIRGYSSHEAWKPGPMLVQAGQQAATLPSAQPLPSLPLPPDQQAHLAALPELQRSMVVQICGMTRLNVKFAFDCLAGNGWDLEKAVANFNDVKGTLSADAFL